MRTEAIVNQKNIICQLEVSIIANMTVKTNTTTCIEIPHTILVVKLPLQKRVLWCTNNL